MTAPATKILYAAPFRRLEALLAAALDRFAAGDPLRERRVLVTSNRLRDHLQALLAKERAYAGVSFLTLRDLAAELGEPFFRKEGFRRLPPLGGAALGEKVLREEAGKLGPLAGAARISGYGPALYATWTDVIEADLAPGALAEGAAGGDRRWLADLSRLLGALERHLAAHRFYDDALLFRRACLAAEADPPAIPTLIYGFADMNGLQRRLVAACCRAAPAAAFVPAEEEAPACAFAAPQLAWFSAQGFLREGAPAGPQGPFDNAVRALFDPERSAELPDGGLTVVSAPSESREVFELVREILAPKDEGAPGTVGVLLPAAGVYPGLFRETLTSLEVPAIEGHPVPLSETPVGRVFLLWLSLGEEDCARGEVVRLLDEGRFVASSSFGGESADPLLASSWEYLSRSFGHLSRRADWESAIRRARQRMEEKNDGETLRLLDGFADALGRLFEFWERRPARGPLSVHAAAALEAFDALTGPLAGRENIVCCMERLGALGPIFGEVPFVEFREWARRALAEYPVRPEKTLSRISVLPLQDARGLSFDTVVIPALSEGVFPAGGREDPLLPDRLRERLNAGFAERGAASRIPLKKNRAEEDRLLFAAALAAARRRAVLGFSRGGAAGARAQAPSVFLHALAEAAGVSPEEEDFLSHLGEHRAASAVLEKETITARPASLLEYDLAQLMAQLPPHRPQEGALGYLLSAKPGYGRRRASLSDRWRSGALTPQDGIFAGESILPALHRAFDLSRRRVAITRLETFFRCPYRFALENVLGLAERRAEGPMLEFDGPEKGQIVHGVLQRFFRRLSRVPKTLGERSAEELMKTLEGALRDYFEEREGAGDALPPLMESVCRERCRRLLEDYFAQGFHSAYRPLQAEGAFGRKADDVLEIAVEGNGETIGLSGRFDLLESDGEGSYRFVDFKTGAKPPKSAVLAGGALLQVPLYSRYGERQFGAEAEVGGAYVYLDEHGKSDIRYFDSEKMKTAAPQVDALLSFFHETCRSGNFFPVPSEKTCRGCAYVFVCGPERERRAARKADAPLRRRWKELQEKAP